MAIARVSGRGGSALEDGEASSSTAEEPVDTARNQSLWRRWTMLRFSVIGSLNTIAFFGFYIVFQWLTSGLPHHRTIAWAISWIVECAVAHFLHRWWTFESDAEVWQSFSITMAIYMVTLVVSTATFDVLVYRFGWNHTITWWLCAGGFGVFDFFAIGWLAFPERTRRRRE